MRFTNRRLPLVSVVLTLLLASLGLVPQRALAQDEQRFADLLAQRDGVSSLAGPLSGELAQEAGFSTVNGAGVFADSFSTTATFENPATPGSTPWDFGFIFHLADDGAQQMVVDSDGNWYYSPFPDGTLASGFAPSVESAPGATNTLDLVVAGTTAVFGINGEFITRIDLPPAVASDVQVGTGFFTNTTEVGRSVGYLDFEVWPVAGDAESLLQDFETAPAKGEQEILTPELEASPETNISPTSDQEAFAFLLEVQEPAAPLAGPFTANLKEASDQVSQSWAGVNLDAFQAHATFTVPTASDTPWDAGFIFGTSPNGTLRIAVDSLGNWYYSIGSGGPSDRGTITGLVTDPGGDNTIDLFVAEQRAVFGVNGTFVSNIELPDDSAAGDVAAGSAFFSDQTQAERIIAFRDFSIRPFDPNTLDLSEGSDGETADADSQAFASFLADTESITPSFGPFAGRLVETSPTAIAQAPAGVSLADFGAAATVTNPDDLSTLWDAGFQFRSVGDETHRVVLRSNGDVYAVLADGTSTLLGTSPTYDATPGAINALQLFVQGDRALFGINGAFVAAIALPETPVTSDVLVGASIFSQDYVQGRVTAYEGFSVRELA